MKKPIELHPSLERDGFKIVQSGQTFWWVQDFKGSYQTGDGLHTRAESAYTELISVVGESYLPLGVPLTLDEV